MIEIKNLSKAFKIDGGTVNALKDISLKISDGDIFGIIGMSGAGKSTLVRCINMLERPSSGTVIIDGLDMIKLSPMELREVRRNVTMIFQSFNLLMQRTCLNNICLPLELAGIKKTEAQKRALELLDIVGLPDKKDAYPAQLSGGQQQRIAIARALSTNPKVLLCDEATSALDPKTTNSILELIRDINKKLGITVIVITHQMNVIENICNRVAILDKGQIAEEGEVSAVFSNPKSSAGKKLVFPQNVESVLHINDNDMVLRVVYNGAKITSTPVIADMAVNHGVFANILSASTRSIGNKVYGNMLLSLPKSQDMLNKAKAYLGSIEDITIEEVKDNV